MRLTRYSKGDTIIEVMVAFTVFAMVAVGALSVMNQGTASSQNTLETTLVRQQIDNQAEMLRFMHQAFLANPSNTTAGSLPDKFRTIVTTAKTANLNQPSKYGDDCTQTLPGAAANRFVLDPTSGSMLGTIKAADDVSAPPYAQLVGSEAYGIWIEPVLSSATEANGTAQYIDFHVRACWNSSSTAPQRTLGTIVRLYVPENVDTGTAGGGGTPIPGPAANDFTVRGSDVSQCHPHADVERDDGEGDPGWNPSNSAFYMNPIQPQWACQTTGNEVFACVNYDAWFDTPATFTTGEYKLTITYADALSCSGVPIVPAYNFKIAIYVDGVKRGGDYNLVAPFGDKVIPTIGTISDTSVVQIRWWNNHFYSPANEDPDFLIKQIRLERIN